MEALKQRYRWGKPPRTLQALILLPELAAGLLPIILVLRAYGSPRAAAYLIGFTLTLWVVFSGRKMESALARWTLKLRRPTVKEARRVEPLLQEVLQRTGSTLQPTMLTQRSNKINALAYGHHTIALTDTAISLPDEHLKAIIAHEIGHLEEGHTTFGTLRMLAHAPLRAYNEIGVFLAFTSPITALIGVPLILASYALSLPIKAADLLYLPIARWEERSADLYASRAGYGMPLADILDAAPPGRIQKVKNLLSSHPDGALRAVRLKEAEQERRSYRTP